MELLKQFLNALIHCAYDWGELLIAFASFIIAVIALIKSSKAEKLQIKINEMELKLKTYELEKIRQEQEATSLACVEARIISVGQEKHKLKVWNSGNAPAYNVIAKFDGDPNIIMMDHDIQPFEILEANKNYEVFVIVTLGSSPKYKIITEWTDEKGNHHSKNQMGSL